MGTKIEWTERTWNPVTGCTKVSQGCKNCYAERLAPKVFAGQTWPVDVAGLSPLRQRRFTDVDCHPERLDAPLHWKKPRRVFVNSMSDLFHEDVPREFIDRVWSTMAEAKQHTFQILTKRPARMREFMTDRANKGWKADWRNVWLGVSVEDQETADERIPLLLQTPAAVRFVSYEPALGPVNFNDISDGHADRSIPREYWTDMDDDDSPPAVGHDALTGERWQRFGGWSSEGPHIDWIIAGGESGPDARPADPDWFRSVRDQCASAGVPFFFKQWGEWAPFYYRDDGEPKRSYDFGDIRVHRIGKSIAGRLLDGREHSAYPA